MGFRLVPKSVTSNDLEWRNGCVVCVSQNSVAFGTYYLKVVKDTPIHSASERNLVFNDISLMVMFAGDHPQRGR